MKTEAPARFLVKASTIARVGALLSILALPCLAPRAQAQGASVTVSAADFQRMVYGAHLHTQLALKPELEAGLQALLEMQRRNPNASPTSLVGVLTNALQIYRTSAPHYIRTNGFRDEILAAYLDALRQVPAHTNFISADLSLLNLFMLNSDDYSYFTNCTVLGLINSADQRLSSSQGAALKRQALVDDCVARARGNAAFASAMDRLLLPETGVSLADSPATIIGNTNSPLYNSPTMASLLALSQASGNGSLTVSTNVLMNLFAVETQTIWDTIHTNLAVLAQINASNPDLLAYLTNQAVLDANVQLVAAMQQGQQARIASATAAVFVQSELLPLNAIGDSTEKDEMRDGIAADAEIAVGCIGLCCGEAGGLGDILSGGLDMFNLFDPSQNVMSEQLTNIQIQLSNVQTLVEDLSANMNYRFDRVDQSLTTIFDTLNTNFSMIEFTLDAQGQQIAQLNGNVNDIRSSLVGVQSSLDRIESETFAYFVSLQQSDIIDDIDGDLLYEVQFPNRPPISASTYDAVENTFYVYATEKAQNSISSPTNFTAAQLAATGLQAQLTDLPLDANLNYVQQFLSYNLGQPTAGNEPLANPEEWFIAAYANLQLAGENPMWFRNETTQRRVSDIISRGQNVANFCGSLTFSGTNINWLLYTNLGNYYLSDLASFNSQVSATEAQYASSNSFALGAWRNWDVAAPRFTATATEARQSTPKNLIAAGAQHSLALKPDGTVAGWGDNSYGQTAIPAGLANLVAISAGNYHSLALKANSTVTGWGNNTYGQISIPVGLTNVVAIAAGATHSLALKSDGTVVGWGNNASGQTNIPAGLTNVVAIAAGTDHSLALKADGTVVGWGSNASGQTNIPAGLTGVIAIAAGADHGLALRIDGTVFGWGGNYYGQATDVPQPSPPFSSQGEVMVSGQALSNVVAIAAGGYYSLALLRDGTVFGWGENDRGEATGVPSGQIPPIGSGFASRAGATVSGVVAIAADGHHSLALRTDGSIVGWGDNQYQQNIPCGAFYNPRVRTQIAAGGSADEFGHSVVLKSDGTIVCWGDNYAGQTSIPASATNVVAVAAGYANTLVLKADGTVFCWGLNQISQTNIPANVTNVVAIASEGYHNLALKADGTVVGWGESDFGLSTPPASATNVVAIAAGSGHSLALKADGTVLAWGWNFFGQTNVPPNATNVVAIAAFEHGSLALKADGTFVSWGYPEAVPASATNVVAIAGGDIHYLALRSDGTVVGWGDNTDGESTTPVGLTNVVAIAAGGRHSLALKADGTIVGWGANGSGQLNIPANAIDLAAWGEYAPGLWNVPPVSSPIAAVAAGSAHVLALTSSGSTISWGLNTWGQTDVPPQAQIGVQSVAAGFGHSLALATNGSVLAWGLNDFGQTNIPAGLTNVVSIAAGGKHNLALKADGTVVAWGLNDLGQTNVPMFVPGQSEMLQGHVVAISAGGEHSLALTSDGYVVAWGDNADGQTSVPAGLSGVVAITTGRYHSLALTTAGQVLAWGCNSSGQCNVPTATQSGVVAIAAGLNQSLALKADGTLVVWGSDPAAFLSPQVWENLVAIAAGDQHSLLLGTGVSTGTNSVQTLSFARAQIPRRVAALIQGCNSNTIVELGRAGDLNNAAAAISGAKLLLTDVLELGMPYTLAHDEILHGFLYGSESMTDYGIATNFLQTQNAQLQTWPGAPTPALVEWDWLSYLRFNDRLHQCLTNLQATGQAEIPRLVGHTLRLLNLLNDAWTQPANSPRPALEMWRVTNSPCLLLFGEPYMRYTLQYRDALSAPSWTTTTITNLQDSQTLTPPLSGGPQRYYRAMLPMP